jgi:LmbE family N-acetylglucosaminyl deacetylase
VNVEQQCLLGVFAHPDDEIGMAGAYRRYHDAGAMTALICATRGEAGEISDAALATPEALGQVREQELRTACRIMGVEDLSFLEYHDGRLADADPMEVIGRIVRHIRRLRPQVIVTFGPNGGYGHRDHIAIHRCTVAAFHQAGDPDAYPEQQAEGLQPYAPRKLYYTGYPRGLMRRLMEQVVGAQPDFQPFGAVATIPVAEMGTADEEITTTLPLDDALYAVRTQASEAHRTQQNPNGLFAHITPEVMRMVWGTQYFVRAIPAVPDPDGSEHDLFAGVILPGS